MADTKKQSSDDLSKQRNPLLFLAEHHEELRTCEGYWPASTQPLRVPRTSLCSMADSHAECLAVDLHIGLRTLSKLMEGFAAQELTTYDDDHKYVVDGVSRLLRVLADVAEAGDDMKRMAEDGEYAHKELELIELRAKLAIAKTFMPMREEVAP